MVEGVVDLLDSQKTHRLLLTHFPLTISRRPREGGDLWATVDMAAFFNGKGVPAFARTTGIWGGFAVTDFKS